MRGLPLHLSRSIFVAPKSGRAARTAGVIVLALICGCQDRSVTLTEFSKTFKLTPPIAGVAVVGLILTTDLSASAPIQLNVGCKGAAMVTLTVPNDKTLTQRIDWYSDCAEVSFATGSAVANAITITYRFQTL